MEIVNSADFPHLARWQTRKAAEVQKKRAEREIVEQFGRIDNDEEQIWKQEYEI